MTSDRKLAIVAGVKEASQLVEALIRQGLYAENARATGPYSPMLEAAQKYRQLSVRILGLFEEGEEDAAFWTQVELYAGFLEPALRALEDADGDLLHQVVTPRADVLEAWAKGGSAPRYAADLTGDGDRTRHAVVPPMTEAPPDMVWAPILLA